MFDRADPERASTQKETTDLEVLLESSSCALYYLPRPQIVHHEFRSFIHGKPFRDVLEKGLELLKARGARKWLSDDRGNGPITSADTEWSLNDWAPRAMAAGWKYWAVVPPQKVLGQMNMRRWIETYGKLGVTAQMFAAPDEARRWLIGMQ